MKAAALRQCPAARLIDVTHQVPRHDVLAGSILLERAVAGFEGLGATHIAVVDPGVGSNRRVLAVEIAGQRVLCPDNGLITWAWRGRGPGRAYELTWRPDTPVSDVFHGRDIIAPAAGLIAAGAAVQELARAIDDPLLLDIAPSASGDLGQVIYIDRFGNATTNIPAELIDPSREVHIGGRGIGTVRRTYSDVRIGEPLALIGSSGLLEIAVREGSAAGAMAVKVGNEVHLS
jgi:S-adenosyl-L-methionine hydrolase (adenosine-forming)